MSSTLKTVMLTLLVGLIFTGLLIGLRISQTPTGTAAASSLSSLFALNSVQAWWYVTRAAGLTSYFLMWLSMVWGLAVASRIFQPVIEGAHSYDFHEFLSLLGIGFVVLHVGVLMLDKYLPFSVWQVLIPFVSTYRPIWVGLGVIGFYILLLVTVTFYARRMIGTRAFRAIHTVSLLGYLGTTVHGLLAGTDSALMMTRLLYAATFLVVVFLTVHWMVLAFAGKIERTRLERRPVARRAHGHRATLKRQTPV